jgi:hypothetical protein
MKITVGRGSPKLGSRTEREVRLIKGRALTASTSRNE